MPFWDLSLSSRKATKGQTMEKEKKKPERHYQFCLRNDFFTEPVVKKLQKQINGDTCIIAYIRLMQKTVETYGVIAYEGLEPSIEHEIALKFDEPYEAICTLFLVLQEYKLLVQMDPLTYRFTHPETFICSESKSLHRVRAHRERKKTQQSVTPCNASVTPCNASVTPCNDSVTQCNDSVTQARKTADEIISKTLAEKKKKEQIASASMSPIEVLYIQEEETK